MIHFSLGLSRRRQCCPKLLRTFYVLQTRYPILFAESRTDSAVTARQRVILFSLHFTSVHSLHFAADGDDGSAGRVGLNAGFQSLWALVPWVPYCVLCSIVRACACHFVLPTVDEDEDENGGPPGIPFGGGGKHGFPFSFACRASRLVSKISLSASLVFLAPFS